MPMYVVVSPSDDFTETVRSQFDESDRHEIAPGAWFVRTPLVTSAQVRDLLGIKVGGRSGVVVAVTSGRFTGVGDIVLVEKIQVWEGME